MSEQEQCVWVSVRVDGPMAAGQHQEVLEVDGARYPRLLALGLVVLALSRGQREELIEAMEGMG